MSEIHLQCQCGQRFAADPDRAGQTLACPFCSAPIHVPAHAPQPVDVWHARLADGQVIGPVTRAQLDESAAAGTLPADAELLRQGESAPIRASELYPHLQPAAVIDSNAPARSSWSERAQQDIEHAASNPIDYIVSGPKRPAYQRRAVGGGWKVIYTLMLLFLTGAGIVLLGIYGITLVVAGAVEGFGLLVAMLVMLFAGIFTLAGALFQWRLFFASRKAIGMRDLLGDHRARNVYIVLGMLFVIAPYAVASFHLVAAFPGQENKNTVGQPGQFMETNVRQWTMMRRDGIEVIRFQGTLRQVSGSGATVTREGGNIAGRFADFSPSDREYLRDFMRSTGERIPPMLSPQLDVPFDAPIAQLASIPQNAAPSTPSPAPIQPIPVTGIKFGVPDLPVASAGSSGPPPVDPAVPVDQELIDEPLNIGATDDVLIAGSDPPLAFAFERDSFESQLRIYELRSGELLKQYNLPGDKLLAAAPDGSRVVLENKDGLGEKLFAYQLDEKATLAADWQPFEKNSPSWIAFATVDRLFSGSSRYEQKSWSWPPASPLKVFEQAHRYEFTPGRNFFIERVVAGLQFRSTSDGLLAGAIRFDPDLTPHAISVSRDGTRLIAVISRARSSESLLGCWDLKAGSRMFLVPLGPAEGAYRQTGFFQWLGPDYVLCGNLLASIAEGQIVWRFTRTPVFLRSPDHRLWTSAAPGTAGSHTLLAPNAILDEPLLAKIKASGRSHSIVKPGDKVSVDIEFQAAPPSPEMRARIRSTIEQKVREAGWQIAPGQTRKAHAVIGERDGGGTLLFGVVNQRTLPRGGQTFETPTDKTINVPNRTLFCKVGFFGAGGEQWSGGEFEFGPRKVPDVELKRFQKFTPEMVLDLRWDVMAVNLDRGLRFKSEMWSFAQLGTSAMSSTITRELVTKQAEIRQAAILADFERRKPKIDLPWEPAKPAWAVEPDPHPDLSASALRRTLRIAAGEVQAVKFATEAGQLLVQIHEKSRKAGDDDATFVHRFQLRGKKRLARTVLPTAEAKLVDFRPDGQVWLVQPTPDENTLQVWKSGEGEDRKIVDVKLPDEPAVKEAFFLGRSGLLVFDGKQLVARKLPTGEPIYQYELNVARCFLSWGRRYFIDTSGSQIALYKTADGTLAGQLAPLPGGNSLLRMRFSRGHRDVSSAAFHPDGKTLALLVGTTIGIWDLQDGSLIKWMNSPSPAREIRWCGPKHLLVDNKLFDLEWEAPIWSYSNFLPDSPDGRGWFVAEDSRDISHIAAISMPSTFVLEPIDKIKDRKPALLLPNEDVRLQISVSTNTDRREALTARLKELFTEQLAAQGIDVLDDARHLLSVSYNSDSERRNSYRFQRDGVELIVENRLLEAVITFSQGSSIWKKQVMVDLPSVDYVIDPDSDDPGANLLKQQEERMFELLGPLSPPFSLPPAERGGFGRSNCDINGEAISVDYKYRF